MGLTQLNFEGKNKVEVAIMRLKEFEPPEGYYLAFSGGKDSVAIYDLAIKAGVQFDAHYNVSPIDPIEIMGFIRSHYEGVIWDKLAKGFWKRFLTEGPPMRHMRWCCKLIKEAGGINRRKVTGIRWAESPRRKRRGMFEACYTHPGTFFLHPIIDWTDTEVWEYITDHNLPYCSLYNEGLKRLGCILCPFESPLTTSTNLYRFPKIVANWRRAFERYYQVRIDRGTPLDFRNVEEYWQWWLSRGHRDRNVELKV